MEALLCMGIIVQLLVPYSTCDTYHSQFRGFRTPVLLQGVVQNVTAGLVHFYEFLSD